MAKNKRNSNAKMKGDNRNDGKNPRNDSKYDSQQYNRGKDRYDRNSDDRATKYHKPRRFQEGERATVRGSNDISWYTRNPNLLLAAGSIPYPYRPGMGIDLGRLDGVDYQFKLPGVMCLDWMPSVGKSIDSQSPANIVGKEIYARVRQAYTGSLDADAPDYIIYLMSVSSVFNYIASLKRIYRVLNAWTPENHVLPDGLLAAMHLSKPQVQALRSNMTQFWQVINTLVLESRKFTCPALMDLFNRHYWMNDNVYADANSLNAQFYVFNQVYFMQYMEQKSADGSGVDVNGLGYVSAPWIAGSDTNFVDNLLSFGEALLNALTAWDDAYTINGYLKKAYDGVPSFIVDEIAINDVLSPVYNEEVLTQIENSRGLALYDYITPAAAIVTQNPTFNTLVFTSEWTLKSAPADPRGQFTSFAHLVSIRSDQPTVADTTIATRLHAWEDLTSVTEGSATTYTVSVISGSEIPLRWLLLSDYNAESGWYSLSSISAMTNILTAGQQDIAAQNLLNVLRVTQFDWHPITWVSTKTTAAYGGYRFAPLGDIHNTTKLTKDTLDNLHRVCLYSEFNAFAQ